jgi:regulator of sigma E protease
MEYVDYSLAFLLKASAFLVMISVVVFIHEYGHYFVGKLCGVKAEEFSIGFGKELFGFQDKSGTRWKFCLIPLGGFVKFFGDKDPASNPDKAKIQKMTKAEKEMSLDYKPLWKKTLIVTAGPVANFILSIVVLTFLFSYYGKPTASREISDIVPDSPAQMAGMVPGDIVLEIDGEVIGDYTDISRIVAIHPDMPLEFVIDHKGEITTKTITPTKTKVKDAFGNEVEVGRIGVVADKLEYKNYNLADSFKLSISETYSFASTTLTAFGQMIRGERGLNDLGGPIRIATYTAQSTTIGLGAFLWLMAVISANLGLINLFPIPVLDGGHVLFYAIEAIAGAKIAERFAFYGMRAGIGFILLLLAFSTINDLRFIGLF